ncbi:Uncharacterised protein [Mycobacteroides abscessus subsp. massiliense]|nr:Uncharacterised protein [Mycobacteroides abscessus subsp. massiliense]
MFLSGLPSLSYGLAFGVLRSAGGHVFSSNVGDGNSVSAMIRVSIEMNRDQAILPWRLSDRSLGPKRRAERERSNESYSPPRAKCLGSWRILVHIVNHPFLFISSITLG